jgi:hypothetical protein
MTEHQDLTERLSLILQEEASNVMVTPATQAEQKFWHDHATRTRRRRTVVLVSVAAGLVAVAALAATVVSSPKAEQPPADNDRLANATEFIGSSSRPALKPGTYALHVSPELTRPVALVDLPAKWHAWTFGPDRGSEKTGYANLIVTDVYDLARKACQPGDDGMRPLSGDPAELEHALADMPGWKVVARPEPDGRFGEPATRLRLRGTDLHCPYGTGYLVSQATGIGQVLSASDQARGLRGAGAPRVALGSEMDAWVVDTADRAVLVLASWQPDTAISVRKELASVVDSIEFVPPE